MRDRYLGIVLLLSLLGCGGATGGSEAGNPSRTVTGSVPASAVSGLKLQSAFSCVADTVIATNSRDEEVSATVQDDCSFALDLPSDEAYQIDFELEGVYAATMTFENSPGRFSTPVMLISAGEDPLSLDEIIIVDETAIPGREPSRQNDQDGDGLPDFSETDADGDGVPDTDEEDCDLDGIINDFDERNTDCVPAEETGKILETLPRNGEGQSKRNKVKRTKEVKARFSCTVDPETVSGQTFRIFPQEDPASLVSCRFAFSNSSTTVECLHDEALAAETVYEARLDGISCSDGTSLPATRWSWQTEE